MRVILFFTILAGILIGCKQEDEIVAEFGKQKINLTEFKEAYLNVLKQPDVFDSPELREHYLDELINRRLLSAQAEKEGFGNDERLIYQLNAYRNKILREIHYQHVIKPKVIVDKTSTERVFTYSTQKRELKHLFTTDPSEADSLYELLNHGADWNDLARQLFNDEKLAKSGGSLGWVHWDQLEYDLAMTAFDLPVNTFSQPVQSTHGYHILLVTNAEINPLISEEDYHLREKDIQRVVELKLGEKIASQYIREMMTQIEIVIRPEIMQLVGARLKTILTRQPNQFDRRREMQLTDQELDKINNNLWSYRHEVLAIVAGHEFTIGEFISALNYVPYEAVYRSFKTALDVAIRDFVLTEEAKQRQLSEKYPIVNLKSNLYRDYLLQLNYRRKLVTGVVVTDKEISDFYATRKDQYYHKVSLDQVKEEIRSTLEIDKRKQAVSRLILELREKQFIKKNTEIIHSYYDNLIKN